VVLHIWQTFEHAFFTYNLQTPNDNHFDAGIIFGAFALRFVQESIRQSFLNNKSDHQIYTDG